MLGGPEKTASGGTVRQPIKGTQIFAEAHGNFLTFNRRKWLETVLN
jgi:hypothetical protein